DPFGVGDLDQRSIGARLDLASVQLESNDRCLERSDLVARECVHGVSSGGKYLTTQSIGFGAAWPRPQIDASRITSDRSASSGRSQRSLAINIDALAVPLRHGVHCPHDSCSKKRIVLRAATTALSWSDKTTTAAEPMKQPCGCNVSKSSGTSASDAGRMPPDAPPGR